MWLPTFGDKERLYLQRSFLLTIGVRVGLLIVAYLVGRVILDERSSLEDMLTNLLNRWDAPHYLRIADVGYRDDGEDRLFLVFFPLYPLAVRIFHFIIPHYVWAALAVSFLTTIVAGYFLQALASLDMDDAETERSLWYFFLFPTAYFLALPYTEALFMATLLGSYFAARRGRWAWAGVLGMLACATRLQGLTVLPALAIEAAIREKREAPYRASWLLLVPIGFLVYLAINWQVLGDPLAFMDIQRDHWFHETIFPWESLQEAFRAIRDNPVSADRVTIFEGRIVAFFLTAALLAASVRWLRPSYQVYCWLTLIWLMSVSWQISMPRYVLSLFPLFFILARWGGRPGVHQALLAASAVSMSGFFAVYASGRWAF